MKRCHKCRFPLEGKIARLVGKLTGIKASATHPGLCTRCAADNKNKTYVCQICNRRVDEKSALTHVKAEEYLLGLIKKDHPEWQSEKGACPACITYYRDLIKKAEI